MHVRQSASLPLNRADSDVLANSEHPSVFPTSLPSTLCREIVRIFQCLDGNIRLLFVLSCPDSGEEGQSAPGGVLPLLCGVCARPPPSGAGVVLTAVQRSACALGPSFLGLHRLQILLSITSL